jgi:hypothetical protein
MTNAITIRNGLAWRREGEAFVTLTPGEAAAEIERLHEALNNISHRWICRLHNTRAYRERTWEERALAAESERDEMYQIANAALTEDGANEPRDDT